MGWKKIKYGMWGVAVVLCPIFLWENANGCGIVRVKKLIVEEKHG